MFTETILCVDDEPTVLDVLRAFLTNIDGNAKLEIAESGEEALEICAELQQAGREISVVISDFIMPNMRGDEFLVRLHRISPRTVKIMLTGQSDLVGVKRAINEADLYRFLDKPFNYTDLLLTVKSGLLLYRQRCELERRDTELEQINIDQALTLNKLRAMQSQLVLSERMAALGFLIAQIIYALNNPNDTMKSRGAGISEFLTQVLNNLPQLLQSLDQDSRDLFITMIQNANQASATHDDPAQRAALTEITRQLGEGAMVGAQIPTNH